MLVDIGPVTRFGDRSMTVIDVQGREFGIVSWEGSWFALRNVCPHYGGPVCEGHLRGHVTGDAETSEVSVDTSRPVITCGWHPIEFDVKTGRSLTDDRLRIKQQKVVASNGRLLLEVSSRQ
jgi:nitrite reductase/ring-hydroxylating ferredoxin subunit